MELSSKGPGLHEEEFYKVHWRELLAEVLDCKMMATPREG